MSTDQLAPQDEGVKVFAGNLAFATKDADLTELFSKFGKVLNAQVINRGTRSLGYGFISFADQAEAEKAVAALDKTEVAGRSINVELAKPQSTTPRPPREKKVKPAPVAAETNGDAEEVVENGEPKPKKKKARKPKARKPKADGEATPSGEAPVSDLADKLATTGLDDQAAVAKSTRARKARAPRAEGSAPVRKGPPTGAPSKTLLFVANLAFSVDDAKLGEIFSAYKPVSARVVTKKVGPSTGRSKGFGFVEFESEEQQQKALNEVQGKDIDGRELQIKIALGSGEKAAEVPAAATEGAEADVVA